MSRTSSKDPLAGLNLGLGRRVPLVLQTEAAECGLACLAMVAGHAGGCSDLALLRRRFGLSLRGATLRDLVRIAERLGFAARPLRLEIDELGQLAMPCILHWDLSHFVVLKSVTGGMVTIHDPAVGVQRLPLSEVSKRFSGIALELVPAPGFKGMAMAPAPQVRLGALVGRMVGIGRALGQLSLLALALEVLAVASPLFMQWVIDHALVTADRDLLTTLALAFLMLLAVRTGIAAMRGWMVMALGASLKVQGRANLLSHLLRLPASWFESRHLGDVVSRFGSQETILQAITTDLVEAVLDGLLAVVTLAVMFAFAPRLATLVVAGAVLYAVLRGISYGPLRQASAESIVWAARRDSHFLETLRGIHTIKLFNGQDERRARWLNLLVETINRQLTTQKLYVMLRALQSLLTGGLAILVVWLGGRSVLEHQLSVGMLLAFITYKDQFLGRVGELVNRGLDFQMLRLHGERLADIALTEPEQSDASMDPACVDTIVGDASVGTPAPATPVAIELRDVRFRYGESDPWVLDGISLRIEAGESVAIVGPSGCGKTTLLKLLSSLQAPTSGEILIDGRPLTAAGIEVYRMRLGVVMQEDRLFAGSLADNISFFASEPDAARIEESARLAAIDGDIASMPMGYGTLIGDMGTAMSGGQKQRVLIARALYRRPGLLLLDEATSHLDVDRERAVNQSIRALGVTRVTAAHRPETIRSADRVIALEGGRVVRDEKASRAEVRAAAAAGGEAPE